MYAQRNRKVLLRDRKKRTTRGVSCPWRVMSEVGEKGREGTPILVLSGGYPCPGLVRGWEGEHTCPGPD